MIHDVVMLNALADTPVARGELAQANAALKTASEWCVSNRGSSDLRKPQMDRTTFVAQSTRGDSACAVPQHTARQTSIRGLPDSAPLPTSSHRTGKSARFLGPLPRARTHVGRTKDATDRKPRVHRSGGSYVVELYRGASSQRDRQQSPGRADRAVSGTRRSTKSGLGSRLMRRSSAARAIDLDWMHVMTTGGGFGRRAMVDADVIAEAPSLGNWSRFGVRNRPE